MMEIVWPCCSKLLRVSEASRSPRITYVVPLVVAALNGAFRVAKSQRLRLQVLSRLIFVRLPPVSERSAAGGTRQQQQSNQQGCNYELPERSIRARSHKSHLRMAQILTKVLTIQSHSHQNCVSVVVVRCACEMRGHAQNRRFIHVHAHADSELLKRAADSATAFLQVWNR